MAFSYQALILAAGRSRRFNTTQSKLTHTICGQKMIVYPFIVCDQLAIPTICVIGHQKEEIVNALTQASCMPPVYVEQKEQKGTGHAVACSQAWWDAENILIMNGDMPLVTGAILQALINRHERAQATVTFAVTDAPGGSHYGRVVRRDSHIAIVEAPHCTEELLKITRVNAGIYIFKRAFLETQLPLLPHHNNDEIYITDLIEIACKRHEKIEMVEVPYERVQGINTLAELSIARRIKQQEVISYWMNQGVNIMDPESTSIDVNVSISRDSCVEPGVILEGTTSIGKNCTIGAYSIIKNSTIFDDCIVKSHCVIDASTVKEKAQIGPFAHLRNHAMVQEQAIIGNFVEVNQSSIGAKTKAKHLSYLGNAQIGTGVTIGAGTITCNYNGVTKETTIIHDNAFVGCNSSLVAPVIVGSNSIVAAGSVITQEVPVDALALARARQVNKEQYAALVKEKNAHRKRTKNGEFSILE